MGVSANADSPRWLSREVPCFPPPLPRPPPPRRRCSPCTGCWSSGSKNNFKDLLIPHQKLVRPSCGRNYFDKHEGRVRKCLFQISGLRNEEHSWRRKVQNADICLRLPYKGWERRSPGGGMRERADVNSCLYWQIEELTWRKAHMFVSSPSGERRNHGPNIYKDTMACCYFRPLL